MLLENKLRLAIENDELELAYQPQITLNEFSLIGMEALLRWKNEELGDVSPFELITIAENTGIIVQIGEWVLKMACRQLALWREQGFDIPRIAVNISLRQFAQTEFVETVTAIINNANLDACDIELEITESVLAGDVQEAINKLTQLKEVGVQLSIDDFGTGYSSLSYLKQFPIDRLKIDKSFIIDMCSSKEDRAITKSIIGLARGLSLNVIAEGVELQEHLQLLKEYGCDEAQGYYISKPHAADDLEEFLEQMNSSGFFAHKKIA